MRRKFEEGNSSQRHGAFAAIKTTNLTSFDGLDFVAFMAAKIVPLGIIIQLFFKKLKQNK